MNLSVSAARPNPQGTFHYGNINITGTLVLKNDAMFDGHKLRNTVNGISFVYPDTPLKLADYYRLSDAFESDIMSHTPHDTIFPVLGTSIVDAIDRDFVHVVFQNPLKDIQTWHLDGHSFFVVG
jgi:hypothetical protein